MRRLVVLGAASILVVAVASAGAATPGFRYGVAAGEITATSAVIWTRAPKAGPVEIHASGDGWTFVQYGVSPRAARAISTNDLTVQFRLPHLEPDTTYRYWFVQGKAKSLVGTFRTARPATADEAVHFGISGDADATPGPSGKPGFNRFEVYGRMADERNDFNINLGDTIYSDSELAGAAVARTVAEKWGKYRLGLALPALQRLRASAGLYSHWDDHEFVNDFSLPEHGQAIYRAGATAFTDYAPVSSGRNGLYRSFRWGKHLELFFLDERSFRSAKVRAICKNDLAPTAPQPVRNAFAALVPSLATQVPQPCLDALADPSRTMLGARQYAAFTKAIKASTATWKVIVNEVPIQQFFALPYDRWEGYPTEREKLLRFLQRNVRNVLFLTTDTHANFVNEVRLSTFGAGGPVGTGIWEVVTGPVATNTQNREVDATLGQRGMGSAITALFYKPAPPRGVGMACASADVYSYAEVKVTGAAITVTPKDAAGALVREETGGACGPFTFKAR